MAAETPSGYTGGALSLAANTPINIGQAIQQFIDKNAPMAAFQVSVQADKANTTPILLGKDALVGTGSPPQGTYSLEAGQDRIYGGGTGNNIPIGRIYAMSTAAAVLRVEIFP